MRVAEGFRGYALAPLRHADDFFRAEKLEEAFSAIDPVALTSALTFAIDWSSAQLGVPRARIARRISMSKLERAIARVQQPQAQALAIVRQHSGGVAAFISGFIGGFLDALTGVPVGGPTVSWLASFAQDARLKEPTRAIELALSDYEGLVNIASTEVDQLLVSEHRPRRTFVPLLAAVATVAVLATTALTWLLLR